VQDIQYEPELKAGILRMYRTYVKKKRVQQKVDNDIKKEYRNQINYLKKSVSMLKKNLQKDFDIHRKDNQRIMRENVELIK